ncbi:MULTISPECIES: PadR family transcriptional regulator [Enterobacteriaceae]|jgi:DNA-binding PadR family transcriptional regulator|uniref:PadR family transcriptional regulator n=2 Tax=Enterobacteriaceae TaxID=543 RepID=A0ABW1Q7G4_9ENTR|nr:PadR family transcriptional regulator [Phytobacter diazotrophicus]MBS6738185.1 PadR family transcriptional regulator [Enterobacteriaceae bacterium]PTA94516.1 PadR family transcriptional regulator [Kluyvera sp. Nf5]SLK03243.1 DNA-binding transcriptional regulator, PadR family [Enterobacter sp. NFR05]BBE75632.1 PadR family transcriptional regulator [Phytobacter sp. MRY16-398]MBY6257960.1 PadR family transcriptional regulator [Phytobacter diazotrophicus]
MRHHHNAFDEECQQGHDSECHAGRRGEHHRGHHGEAHHGRGGGRRQRFFGHGELRLVILDILTRNASHGYELIKEIETLTQGNYTPSPGVIYPTLDLLQDQQFIIIHEEDGGRKKIAITSQGQAWLAENSEHLQHIQARIKARSVGYQLRKDPQMKRALENFKAVLDLKVNQSEISAAQLKQIIGIIDRAALDISQLD